MAQGIRTIAGYTNSYPTVTWNNNSFTGTGVWNTTYIGGVPMGDINITIPSYAVTDGTREIRMVFQTKESGDVSLTITAPSGATVYGVSDITVNNGKFYEVSITPLSATTFAVICKEWS